MSDEDRRRMLDEEEEEAEDERDPKDIIVPVEPADKDKVSA
jgi:hypothetical protein